MFSRLFVSVLATSLFSFNALAINGANPFAKSEVLNVGKDVTWEINKDAGVAVKSAVGEDDSYYHLEFDNRQIKLTITSDKKGQSPKYFSQLEIKDLKINGKQSSLFKWCLNNQQKHSRFLQQGLTVKNNVCQLNANNGSFIMRLNKATLSELQKGSHLQISLKPFRTQLDIKYDISDFAVMYTALNAKPVAVRVAPVPAVSKPVTMCKDQSNETKDLVKDTKDKTRAFVFLKHNPKYPLIKDISMIEGREPKPLMDCNGLDCAIGEMDERNPTEKEINYGDQLEMF